MKHDDLEERPEGEKVGEGGMGDVLVL